MPTGIVPVYCRVKDLKKLRERYGENVELEGISMSMFFDFLLEHYGYEPTWPTNDVH